MAADALALPEKQIPSTAGMTTKVVKGSLWTLAGQVAPMAVSFVATPFTIRFLGSEGYGVLILIGLIPMYFAFADFGMSLAATKFGSEAYGRGDTEGEARTVRTAAFIAVCSTLPVAAAIFILSLQIAVFFNVPDHLLPEASLALKFAAATLVINALTGILNAPQLARLRMDINSLVNAVPKVLMIALTPVVLYLGGGLLEAVLVGFVGSLAILAGVIIFSRRLLPQLRGLAVDRVMSGNLFRFGGGWVVASIAAILLVNLEKIFLARLVSIEALAFYSVAFTFVGVATMFSSAMLQSLGPAFAQLNAPEKKPEFDALFARGMRLNLLWLPPAMMFLFVIARPFFTVWAGETFGRESTLPFYILLFGLFFNILAYIPFSTITAKGRTDLFAKLYWIEIIIYSIAAIVLINSFGIVGAAAAYSLRVILDAFIIIGISRRVANVSFRVSHHFTNLFIGIALLLPPMLVAAFYDNFSMWLCALVPFCLAVYAFVMWQTFVEEAERIWIKSKMQSFFRFA